MAKITNDVEELMNRVRAEAARRKLGSSSVHYTVGPVSLPRVQQPHVASESQPSYSYSLTDFLAFYDEDFVRNAYYVILKRSADEGGLAYYLSLLRTGSLSRLEILGRLRYSSEGRLHGVAVAGLWPRYLAQSVFHVPVLGHLLALIKVACSLPGFLKKWRQFDATFNQKLCEQRVQSNAMAIQVEEFLRRADQQFQAAGEDASRVHADIASLRQLVQKKTEDSYVTELANQLSDELARKVDSEQVGSELAEIRVQILDHKQNILDQQRRLVDQQRRLAMLLDEARKHLSAPIGKERIEAMVAEEDHLLDALFASFEDRFRGTREDIKKHLQIYLPVVRKECAGVATAPILDIGCGRGEWLDLLKENGLQAKGIDHNRVMIDQCHERAIDAVEAEAINYLRGLKPNSLGAVTGFNLIEHIPFKRLVVLFDEILRVLKSGGVVIFESPNPENLVVGACNFYYDPTHLNPLPPPMVQYLAEMRGFVRARVERIAVDQVSRLSNDVYDNVALEKHPILKLAQERLLGAPDYAVIAYK